MDNLEAVKKSAIKNKVKNKSKNDKPKELLATPSNVRSDSSKKQRIFKMAVTLVYAFFCGIGIYHIQKFGIDNGASLKDSSAMFYKAISFVMAVLTVTLNAYYIFYSARVQNNMPWKRMTKHLINGLFPLIAVVLLAAGIVGKPNIATDGTSVASGTNIFIYISAIGVIGSAGWTLVENILQRKRFPNAYRISRNLFPGVLIALVGFILLSTGTSAKEANWGDVIMPALIYAAGAIMVFFASALSFRSSDYGNRLKKLIKYGYVSHLIVTAAILTCFMFSKANFGTLSKDTFSMIVLVAQLIATALMIGYIIYTSRNKKNLTANPIHNRILLMSYLGFVNVMGLLAIFTSPKHLETVKLKSEFAFTFLGISSLLCLLTLVVAGVMAFMTVEFKGFTSLAMASIQLILILFLSMVIFSEPDVAIISDLMGRFVILLIYSSVLVVYLLFEAYWILFLFLGEKSDKKELKRAEAALKAKEQQEEGQNA